MRFDYVLYAVAIVFFIVTLAAAVYLAEQPRQVWVVTTFVIGIAFIGLGYTQRPRPAAAPVTTSVPPPPTSQPQQQPQPQQQQVQPEQQPEQQPQQQPQQQVSEVTTTPTEPIVTNVVKLEETMPVVQRARAPQSPVGGLTDVKGIGEKRAVQIRSLGISSVEDLAKASASDLATKLKISPKITAKWIESAKEIGQKS